MSAYYPEGCTQSTIDNYFGSTGGGYLSTFDYNRIFDENKKISARIAVLEEKDDRTPEEEKEIYNLSMLLEDNEEELRKDDEYDAFNAKEDALFGIADAKYDASREDDY